MWEMLKVSEYILVYIYIVLRHVLAFYYEILLRLLFVKWLQSTTTENTF